MLPEREACLRFNMLSIDALINCPVFTLDKLECIEEVKHQLAKQLKRAKI